MKLFLFLPDLQAQDEEKLEWILMTPFQETGIHKESFLKSHVQNKTLLIEIGPR